MIAHEHERCFYRYNNSATPIAENIRALSHTRSAVRRLYSRVIEEEAKFVPAIVTEVGVDGAIIKLVDVIVGLVSPTVTEPPNATAEPLIVIAPVPTKAELGTFEIVLLEPLIVLFVKVCDAVF